MTTAPPTIAAEVERSHRTGRTDPFCEAWPGDFVERGNRASDDLRNCMRATIGLPGARTREWLLDIDFGQRDTFAYSCEAYARILERARNPAQRRALAADFANDTRITADRVAPSTIASVVTEGPRSGTDGRPSSPRPHRLRDDWADNE